MCFEDKIFMDKPHNTESKSEQFSSRMDALVELIICICVTSKGSLQIEFLEKFGNLAQPGRPPPPSPKVGTPKTKKKIDVYFAF